MFNPQTSPALLGNKIFSRPHNTEYSISKESILPNGYQVFVCLHLRRLKSGREWSGTIMDTEVSLTFWLKELFTERRHYVTILLILPMLFLIKLSVKLLSIEVFLSFILRSRSRSWILFAYLKMWRKIFYFVCHFIWFRFKNIFILSYFRIMI